MNKTKTLSLFIVIFILLTAVIVMFFVDFNRPPYDSYLSIHNTIVLMRQMDLLTAIVNNREYYIEPDLNFLEVLDKKEWKEVKVKNEPESKSTLTIKIRDNGHELVFFPDKSLALIAYCGKTSTSKKWYKVPSDTCTNIEKYIVENAVQRP